MQQCRAQDDDQFLVLTKERRLDADHLLHAVRGTLAAELGDFPAALAHLRTAAALAELPSEKTFLAQQIRECEKQAQSQPQPNCSGRAEALP